MKWEDSVGILKKERGRGIGDTGSARVYRQEQIKRLSIMATIIIEL